MNENQRKLLLGVAGTVFCMLVYPPYRKYGFVTGNTIQDTGYAWLFDLPPSAVVDILTLLVQWLGILIVGAILFLCLKQPGSGSKD